MEETENNMSLEDQKVNLDKAERLKDLIEERMFSKYFWDE